QELPENEPYRIDVGRRRQRPEFQLLGRGVRELAVKFATGAVADIGSSRETEVAEPHHSIRTANGVRWAPIAVNAPERPPPFVARIVHRLQSAQCANHARGSNR